LNVTRLSRNPIPYPEESFFTSTYTIYNRLFVLLAGLAHVTLPSGPEEAWIMEGVNGFLVATDTTGIGHYTTYPSNKNTVALQIPFKDGIVPEHVVLKKSGACDTPEQVIKANNIEEWYIRTDL
jgi:hypothetical protein